MALATRRCSSTTTSGESVFLDKGPDGWKLSAIACKVEDGKPRDRPLDCEVEA